MRKELIIQICIALVIFSIPAFFLVRRLGSADEPPPVVEPPLLFPTLHINTAQHPFDMERGFFHWIDGSISLEGMQVYDFVEMDVRVRGRGNTTWMWAPEKRPLRLRFPRPVYFPGSLYAHQDWILLANHFDVSMLRNHAAFYLSNLMCNIPFTHVSHFVHVYINGVYYGVYELTDERDTGPGRANLHLNTNPALSEYLFELDGHLWGRGMRGEIVPGVDFFSVDGRDYDLRFPRQQDWNGHREYLQAFVYRVSDAIHTQDYETIRAVIDVESFIDYYLVMEWMKVADVGWFSVFMSVRGVGDERRLHFGPVWDFDRSAGHMPEEAEPEGLWAARVNRWFYSLLAVPEIAALRTERWNEIYAEKIPAAIENIRFMFERYEQEFARNFVLHDVFGRPMRVSPYEIWGLPDHAAHVAFLIEWLEIRSRWLDDAFNGRPTSNSDMFINNNPRADLVAGMLYLPDFAPIGIRKDGAFIPVETTLLLINNRNLMNYRDVYAVFGIPMDAAEARETDFAHAFREYVFIPVRELAEALGYEVEWNPDERVVELTYTSD